MDADADVEGDVGPLDVTALEQIREEFTRVDGLVETAGLDSLLDPTELRVHLDDGIRDAEWCRFDVRWYRTGYYNIHHSDENDFDFRFDYHPKPNAPRKHFHPPPNAGAARQSCIRVVQPKLVTRAVHKVWRRAYETGDATHLNTAENPP